MKYLLVCESEEGIYQKEEDGKTGLDWQEKEQMEMDEWESEEDFQERKRGCREIVKLFESFERNPIETMFETFKSLFKVFFFSFLFFSFFFFFFFFSPFFFLFLIFISESNRFFFRSDD